MHPQLSSSTLVSGDLFLQDLKRLVPVGHELRLLADRIDWDNLERLFQKHYSSAKGRCGISLRILIGLQFLKYMFDESDESVVKRLNENAAWQYFCGLSHYEIKSYCDATTLGRFRNKIGQEGVELLLTETVRIGKSEKVYKNKDLDKIHVDTTVQEKNITFPHDVKHLGKMHKKLLKQLRKKKLTSSRITDE